jgi:hypothetical protein
MSGVHNRTHVQDTRSRSLLFLLVPYRTNWNFRVKNREEFFEWKPVGAGVTKSTLLAPLLYRMCVAGTLRRPDIEISYNPNRNVDYAISNLQIYTSELDAWLHKCTINQRFWEELIAYFPLIRHGPHRKRLLQQSFVSAEKSSPSCYLAMIEGYTDTPAQQFLYCCV